MQEQDKIFPSRWYWMLPNSEHSLSKKNLPPQNTPHGKTSSPNHHSLDVKATVHAAGAHPYCSPHTRTARPNLRCNPHVLKTLIHIYNTPTARVPNPRYLHPQTQIPSTTCIYRHLVYLRVLDYCISIAPTPYPPPNKNNPTLLGG